MAEDPKKLFGLAVSEVIGFAAVLILAFGVLNYFNVISLSLLYPKYFGSLPHRIA